MFLFVFFFWEVIVFVHVFSTANLYLYLFLSERSHMLQVCVCACIYLGGKSPLCPQLYLYVYQFYFAPNLNLYLSGMSALLLICTIDDPAQELPSPENSFNSQAGEL